VREDSPTESRLPLALLGVALAASAALVLALAHDYTFIQDAWGFLLERRGNSAGDFLQPHNEHIVVIPVAIQKALLPVFGLTTTLPELILLLAASLTTAVLVFVYVRRRVGPWPALLAAVLLLFLGPSWAVLLWPFEIAIVGSVMAGVAVLLLLERGDRRGDLLACLALTLSLGFSSLGLSFIAAAAVDVFQRRRELGLGRAWVAAVPLLLFAAWYAGWGHDADSNLSLENILSSPVYLLEGFANSIASLLGLSTIDVNDVGEPAWGRPLLVAAALLVLWGQTRRPGFSPRLWPLAAAAASYWLLAGFNYVPGRSAVAGRYGYAGAVFVLLIAAELLRGVRFSRRALWTGGAVAAIAVASNLAFFREGDRWLEHLSVLTRADTAAIEIARRTVHPEFFLNPEVAGTGALITIDARRYLALVEDHGSPAYTPAELAAAPEFARRQADVVLSQALPLTTRTLAGAYRRSAAPGCVEALPDQEIPLGPGVARIEVAPGPHADFSLRRFALTGHPVKTAGADGGSTTLLRIERDEAGRPWFLRVETQQPARVCPA
jgi:hypothetical protein